MIQWLKQHYYKNALARSERDLEMLEKMFAARKQQIQNQQDVLVCKLWATYPRKNQEPLRTPIIGTSASSSANPTSAQPPSAAISRPSPRAKSAASY